MKESNPRDRMRCGSTIAYLIQNAGIDLAESKGTQLHIRGVAQGMKHTLGSQGPRVIASRGRSVFVVDTPEAIGTGSALSVRDLSPGVSATSVFRCVESVVRRVQRATGLPYLALWDNLRLMDASRSAVMGCDILHAHFDLVPMAATFLSQRQNMPLVVDCEADWFAEGRSMGWRRPRLQEKWARHWQRRCFDTAQAIICVSEGLAAHLASDWRVPKAKLYALPNGVDVDAFTPMEPSGTWRQRLGLDEGPAIVFVGGFYKWHALDQLLESFSLVLAQMPDSKLILVGDGPTRSEMEAVAASLQLQSQVVWAGRIPYDQIPAVLSLADVVVSPFLEVDLGNTRSPLKLFEYMAAGKPCVATATGEVEQIVADGETALLVAPGDIPGFADAIVRLLRDPEARARLGANARRQAIEQHSWERYGVELLRIYDSVLSNWAA